jgi:hypothetical protein
LLPKSPFGGQLNVGLPLIRHDTEIPEPPSTRLRVVEDVTPVPAPRGLVGRTSDRLRQAIADDPGRYRRLLDMGLLAGIGLVLLLSTYLLLTAD